MAGIPEGGDEYAGIDDVPTPQVVVTPQEITDTTGTDGIPLGGDEYGDDIADPGNPDAVPVVTVTPEEVSNNDGGIDGYDGITEQEAANIRNTGGVSADRTVAEQTAFEANKKASQPPKQGFKTKPSAGEFNQDKYNVWQHSFPQDILDPQYGGNYVIYYINVSEEGLINDAGSDSISLDTDIDPTSRRQTIGRPITESVVGAVSTVATLQNAANVLSGRDSIAGGVIKTLGNVTGSAITNAIAPKLTKQVRRLLTAIALHIPNNLQVKYGTTWGTESSAYLDMASAGLNSDVLGAVSNDASMKKMLTTAGAAAANMYLQNQKIGGVSSAFGVAANPKLTQTFQGVEFRTFTYEYTFYPRDEFEADNVMNIIHMFKLHMHPEFKGESDYVWIYPSEFDIIFYTGGRENDKIHKHTTAVLESMNVNYTPNGNYSVFANGQPTQINMSLNFRELQLASKETIGKNAGDGL